MPVNLRPLSMPVCVSQTLNYTREWGGGSVIGLMSTAKKSQGRVARMPGSRGYFSAQEALRGAPAGELSASRSRVSIRVSKSLAGRGLLIR